MKENSLSLSSLYDKNKDDDDNDDDENEELALCLWELKIYWGKSESPCCHGLAGIAGVR